MKFDPLLCGVMIVLTLSGAVVMVQKNRASTRYQIFVLEHKEEKVTLCSVSTETLASNRITLAEFSLYLRKALDSVGETIGGAVAESLGREPLERERKSPLQISNASVAARNRGDCDSRDKESAELTDAQRQACRRVLKEGVVLHEYLTNPDGTLGKMTRKVILKM